MAQSQTQSFNYATIVVPTVVATIVGMIIAAIMALFLVPRLASAQNNSGTPVYVQPAAAQTVKTESCTDTSKNKTHAHKHPKKTAHHTHRRFSAHHHSMSTIINDSYNTSYSHYESNGNIVGSFNNNHINSHNTEDSHNTTINRSFNHDSHNRSSNTNSNNRVVTVVKDSFNDNSQSTHNGNSWFSHGDEDNDHVFNAVIGNVGFTKNFVSTH